MYFHRKINRAFSAFFAVLFLFSFVFVFCFKKNKTNDEYMLYYVFDRLDTNTQDLLVKGPSHTLRC